MKHSNSFVQHMADTYDSEELREIAEHGCASGCASGMIYYSETRALFNQHSDDLFEIMENYQSEIGSDELPNFGEIATTFTGFANAVVWFCAEIIASELLNQGAE
jgi:hypothetical protein